MKRNGLFVVGTDTEVGKTVISAGLALCFKSRGMKIGVMKPFASGCKEVGRTLVSEDAVFLMEAAENQFPALTCPIRLKEPLAPRVAADLEGRNIDMQDVLFAYRELERNYEFIIVEGVGGLMVPLCENWMVADLIQYLALPVVIVGRIGLGTINHTLLTVEALKARGIPIVGIILNGLKHQSSSIAELTNPKVIESLCDVPLLGVMPHVGALNVEECIFGDLADTCEKSLRLDTILEWKDSK